MAKTKGSKGGNPHPTQTPVFKSRQNKRSVGDVYPNEPLAAKPISVKLYQRVYDAISALPKEERAIRMRQALTEWAVNDLGVEFN